MADGDKEKLDRELFEFLNEIRVVLPGVLVLFSFMLTVPFSSHFDQLTGGQDWLFVAAFLSAAIATILLVTPTAYHRVRWRQGDKERLLQIANTLSLLGLVFLGIALTLVVFLVMTIVTTDWTAIAIAVGVGALLGWLWFGLPVSRRVRGH